MKYDEDTLSWFHYLAWKFGWDEDETPETEPVDEPPIVLDGDDESGEEDEN